MSVVSFASLRSTTPFHGLAIIEDESPSASATLVDPIEGNEFFSSPCNRREFARQTREFLIFSRVLVIYSAQEDEQLCRKVKRIISDLAICYRQHKPNEVEFLMDMYARLKNEVSKAIWAEALRRSRRLIQTSRRRKLIESSISSLISTDDA